MKYSPERARRERNARRAAVNADPSRGCEGKERFLTFGQAERVAKLSRKRKKTKFVTYHCRNCQGFHFGNHARITSIRRSNELRTTEIDDDDIADALPA